MNNIELKNNLIDLVNNHATVYAYGCWGNKLTESLIDTKAKQYSWWYTEAKKKELKVMTKLGYTVWGFDCVCMIKSILWGWKADTSKLTGGAVYASNGVPDVSANGMIEKCNQVSTDFSNIEIGEAVWMNGHIGIYIGNGQVVECTPAWKNKVQITKLSQRKWLKHGKLPWITYEVKSNSFLPSRGYIQKGDSGDNINALCEFMVKNFLGYEAKTGRKTSDVLGNYYGDNIIEWIKLFQKNNNLEIDGCIGIITYAKLKEYGFKY